MLIATAGHVDHGKTTLINALTGVDTDRLPEEKKRGLTIELGFAYLSDSAAPPEQITLGFIDVPGHEKFIRNMVSGVGAIDVALLVVAADDGLMPQTREHVAVLDLLGISKCVVAITRSDLVTSSQIDTVAEQARLLLADTTLDCAACIPVCAPTGQGIETLKKKLFELAQHLDSRARREHFRLAIDRRFSVRGAGTVVTGAVFAGQIVVGDMIRLLPGKQTSRIREIHANGCQAEMVVAGQRAALNLSNIDTSDVHKGDWITSTEMDVVSSCLDVRFRLLKSENQSLRHWSPVHLHAGALSVTARLALYNARTISPGEECFAQLVVDKPIHLLFGDRFVLRDQSATRTIGGGHVLDPFASRHRHFRKNRVPVLAALDTWNHDTALVNALGISPESLPVHTFKQARNRFTKDFESALTRCKVRSFKDSSGAQRLLAHSTEESARIEIFNLLAQFHGEQPQLAGVAAGPLRLLCELPVHVFEFLLGSMIRSGELIRAGSDIKLPSHEVELGKDDQLLLNQLLESVTADTIKPPPLAELATLLELDREVLASRLTVLEASGHIVRVSKNRLFHPQALTSLSNLVHDLVRNSNNQGFDAKSFRDLSGIGRNLSIDVLEYFDRTGLTKRIDDRRYLKQS